MRLVQQEQIRRSLNEKGLKATPQRILILAALTERHDHPTAEALYAHVHASLPGLSLGTVYSTLETLLQHALICRVPVAEGAMRYDACTHSHHHIYCTNTAEILDFHDPELDELIYQHLEKKNLTNLQISAISLQIQGNKPQPKQQILFS